MSGTIAKCNVDICKFNSNNTCTREKIHIELEIILDWVATASCIDFTEPITKYRKEKIKND